MPDVHALLSASGAHRWLNCPPSARLEALEEDSTSLSAEEGTAAHALAEYKLRAFLKEDLPAKPTSDFDGAEMESCTDAYRDYVVDAGNRIKDEAGHVFFAVEQRVDFSHLVPEGFGTCDCILIGDGVLHIIDFKYGTGVEVNAEENPQMMLYALGAIHDFGALYDVETVRMSIFQPRRDHVSTWETDIESLTWWGYNVAEPQASLAYNGEGDFNPGSWCQFCRISPTCRARAEKNLELAQLEFRDPDRLEPDEIARVLAQGAELKKWVTDVETWALTQAVEHDQHFEGMKLVAGRSNRRYTSEADVEKVLRKHKYKVSDIRQPAKLLTITAMEKLLGKPTFNELLGDLVTKPEGKPTLVPVSDKRPELVRTQAVDEFDTITDK